MDHCQLPDAWNPNDGKSCHQAQTHRKPNPCSCAPQKPCTQPCCKNECAVSHGPRAAAMPMLPVQGGMRAVRSSHRHSNSVFRPTKTALHSAHTPCTCRRYDEADPNRAAFGTLTQTEQAQQEPGNSDRSGAAARMTHIDRKYAIRMLLRIDYKTPNDNALGHGNVEHHIQSTCTDCVGKCEFHIANTTRKSSS